MPVEVLVLLGLILLNGVFAMSEIDLVTARTARLQVMVDQGDRGAEAAVDVNEVRARFLPTSHVSITSIGSLSPSVGEAPFPAPLTHCLTGLGVHENPARIGATGF